MVDGGAGEGAVVGETVGNQSGETIFGEPGETVGSASGVRRRPAPRTRSQDRPHLGQEAVDIPFSAISELFAASQPSHLGDPTVERGASLS
ncbi:hypothetical protein JCM18882A_07350 [Brevibacterium metallidurans]|uniref:Uncharacterized protein n=1 Tax=Brevibacterium metallidurans TaxID=1482676 RepID=A0ABN0SK27_9MICO